MPRGTRFQRERISKLFGTNPKTKPIQKPPHQPQPSTKPIPTSPKSLQITAHKQPQSPTPLPLSNPTPIPTSVNPINKLPQKQHSTFKSSNYIQIVKVHNNGQQQQIQKLNFKCYEDGEVFGDEGLVSFLKQNYDNDHDTPQEQVKYDVTRGVKKLKEEIQRRKAEGSEPAMSERAMSMGSTPPRFIKIRNYK